MKKLLYLVPILIMWIVFFIWKYFSLNIFGWYAIPYVITSVILITVLTIKALDKNKWTMN